MTYTALRLALFGALVALLAWVGARDWLLVLVAALAAWALSYVLLGRQRAAAARWVERRAHERPARPGRLATAIEEDAAVEDAADDASARPRPERA